MSAALLTLLNSEPVEPSRAAMLGVILSRDSVTLTAHRTTGHQEVLQIFAHGIVPVFMFACLDDADLQKTIATWTARNFPDIAVGTMKLERV